MLIEKGYTLKYTLMTIT